MSRFLLLFIAFLAFSIAAPLSSLDASDPNSLTATKDHAITEDTQYIIVPSKPPQAEQHHQVNLPHDTPNSCSCSCSQPPTTRLNTDSKPLPPPPPATTTDSEDQASPPPNPKEPIHLSGRLSLCFLLLLFTYFNFLLATAALVILYTLDLLHHILLLRRANLSIIPNLLRPAPPIHSDYNDLVEALRRRDRQRDRAALVRLWMILGWAFGATVVLVAICDYYDGGPIMTSLLSTLTPAPTAAAADVRTPPMWWPSWL